MEKCKETSNETLIKIPPVEKQKMKLATSSAYICKFCHGTRCIYHECTMWADEAPIINIQCTDCNKRWRIK